MLDTIYNYLETEDYKKQGTENRALKKTLENILHIAIHIKDPNNLISVEQVIGKPGYFVYHNTGRCHFTQQYPTIYGVEGLQDH